MATSCTTQRGTQRSGHRPATSKASSSIRPTNTVRAHTLANDVTKIGLSASATRVEKPIVSRTRRGVNDARSWASRPGRGGRDGAEELMAPTIRPSPANPKALATEHGFGAPDGETGDP